MQSRPRLHRSVASRSPGRSRTNYGGRWQTDAHSLKPPKQGVGEVERRKRSSRWQELCQSEGNWERKRGGGEEWRGERERFDSGRTLLPCRLIRRCRRAVLSDRGGISSTDALCARRRIRLNYPSFLRMWRFKNPLMVSQSGRRDTDGVPGVRGDEVPLSSLFQSCLSRVRFLCLPTSQPLFLLLLHTDRVVGGLVRLGERSRLPPLSPAQPVGGSSAARCEGKIQTRTGGLQRFHNLEERREEEAWRLRRGGGDGASVRSRFPLLAASGAASAVSRSDRSGMRKRLKHKRRKIF